MRMKSEIERGSRLVGDKDFRIEGNRNRDN